MAKEGHKDRETGKATLFCPEHCITELGYIYYYLISNTISNVAVLSLHTCP